MKKQVLPNYLNFLTLLLGKLLIFQFSMALPNPRQRVFADILDDMENNIARVEIDGVDAASA